MNPVVNTAEPIKKKRVYKKKTADPTVEPPAEKKERELFPHQIDSVELMERAEQGEVLKDKDTGFDMHYSFGSLENPVGSGKTASVLKVIKNDKLKFETVQKLSIRSLSKSMMLTGDIRPFYADSETGEIVNRDVSIVIFPLRTNIVVCSKPLTTVWKKEAELMGVPSVVIDAPRQVSNYDDFFAKVIGVIKEENGIVITTTNLYSDVMWNLAKISRRPTPSSSPLPPIPWNFSSFMAPKRMIYDDVHSVTKWTISSQGLCPLFTWCVNSTPELVPWGRIERYLAGTYLTRPTYSSAYDNREKGHVVNVPVPKETYNLPPVVVSKLYFKRNETERMLGNHLPPVVREMLNIGNFDGAYRYMLARARGEENPDNKELDNQDANLIDVSERKPLHELVTSSYRNKIAKLRARRLELLNLGATNIEGIDAEIAYEEKQMKALKERIESAQKETCECPICCDDVERGKMAITKCCNNAFCKECIHATLNKNSLCPLCRKTITPLDLYSMREDGSAVDISSIMEMKAPRPKNLAENPMNGLLKLVQSKPKGSRFVVFAPNEGSSVSFKEYFKNSGYLLADLAGSSATIRNRLEGFENGSIQILFLNSKTSNAGLNLQFATDVVVIESADNEMNPDHGWYKQSIGRVRRFPRMEAVPVHHIIPEPI